MRFWRSLRSSRFLADPRVCILFFWVLSGVFHLSCRRLSYTFCSFLFAVRSGSWCRCIEVTTFQLIIIAKAKLVFWSFVRQRGRGSSLSSFVDRWFHSINAKGSPSNGIVWNTAPQTEVDIVERRRLKSIPNLFHPWGHMHRQENMDSFNNAWCYLWELISFLIPKYTNFVKWNVSMVNPCDVFFQFGMQICTQFLIKYSLIANWMHFCMPKLFFLIVPALRFTDFVGFQKCIECTCDILTCKSSANFNVRSFPYSPVRKNA